MNVVHLVIPCFQESQRLPAFLPELLTELDPAEHIRVQVVDDGSGEAEAQLISELVEGLQTSFPNLQALLALPANLGKGGAVYEGWKTAAEDATWLGFVDADGSIPPREVARIIGAARNLDKPDTALFGSRVKMLGRQVDRQFGRHFLGRIYATIVSEFLHVPVYDSQCGLKIVPRASWMKVRKHLKIHGFAFDVDLMVNLMDHGCDVREFPIDWSETPGGKVHLIRDSFRMFRDVLRIRRSRKVS
jgi:glycosyltransferase involved in cell wall biosynthesis